MKIALAHDYLIQMGGAERVVAAMHRRFPEAPIFTSAVNRRTLWRDFADADIRTTWLQTAPLIQDHTHFKKYFPFFPAAFRSFRPEGFDRAWISSSTFAKYMHFPKETRTVCYIHNPTRFLWQTDEYVNTEVSHSFLNRIVRQMLPPLRQADRAAAQRMNVLVANSRNVQDRIRRFYKRDSLVVHPPVETDRLQLSTGNDGYHLIVSRLIAYKNIDLAVRAFSRAGKKLIVAGEGPQRNALEQMAGPTVQILGRRSEEEIKNLFARCRAFVFPGDEDFGITPIEAMACGKPVLAYKKGGALETIVEGETGVFFADATEDALLAAAAELEGISWQPEKIRAHAEKFSERHFLEQMEAILLR